jgi:PTH1 family peptidyl-tRNA hydrolase
VRCVAGLGNPGKKYASTRHNIGFIVLDKFAEKYKLNFFPSKKDYYKSEGSIVSSDFFLIKPTTYMNLSGTAVLDFLSENPIDHQDLLVVFDDVNLPVGNIRLRKSGSDGGHNGIKSIIYHLQDDNFPRLRFGIGSDFLKGEMADYVLSKFNQEESIIIEEQIDFAVELIEEFIIGGYKSMSDYFAKEIQAKKIDKNIKDDLVNPPDTE